MAMHSGELTGVCVQLMPGAKETQQGTHLGLGKEQHLEDT